MEKSTKNISGKQNMKVYMKEHCKEHKNNQSNKALRKLKENNELKSVKVGVVTRFIKDEIENTVDSADVDSDDVVDDEQDRITGFR